MECALGKRKNQHYVPQFYLRQFSSEKKTINKFLLESSRYIERASIRNTASKPFFYDEGSFIEATLGKTESDSAPILKHIIETQTIPASEEDYMGLLRFIATQTARTPRQSDTAEQFLTEIAVQLLQASGKCSENDLSPASVIRDTLRVKNALGEHLAVGSVLPMLLMTDLEPFLIINNSDQEFITSDIPIFCYNQLRVSLPGYSFGFGLPGAQIFFPISPKICFCLIDMACYSIKQKGNYIRYSSNFTTRKINKMFCLNAYKELYFSESVNRSQIMPLLDVRKESSYASVQTLGAFTMLAFDAPRAYIDIPFFKIRQERADDLRMLSARPVVEDTRPLYDAIESAAKFQRDAVIKEAKRAGVEVTPDNFRQLQSSAQEKSVPFDWV